MNQNITNRDLLGLHREAQQLQGLRKIFEAGKVSKFYIDNGVRINSLMEKIANLRKEYCEMDGDNIKTNMIEGKAVPVFLEGKTQEAFDQASKDLLSEETVLTY